VSGNREDAAIAAIDALIDEQLRGGPVDDYEADRYVKCELCGQDWHGTPSDGGWNGRTCPGAWAEEDAKASYLRAPVYTDMVDSVRLSAVRGPTGTPLDDVYDGPLDNVVTAFQEIAARPSGPPSVVWRDDRRGRGYTIADLGALRAAAWRPQHHYIRQPGLEWTHRLRLWALAVNYGHGGGHQLYLVEMDRVQVQEIVVTYPELATLRCSFPSSTNVERTQWYGIPAEEIDPAPLTELQVGRINVERFGPAGWEHLGHAVTEGTEMECSVVLADPWRTGHRLVTEEHCTLQFDVILAPGHNFDQLLNPPERRST
jgi:hypothetical protein